MNLWSQKYLNRDLSWLQFNDRVLQQACSLRHPLLERLRFLAIASSNYDEFVMKRIGHIQRLMRKNITESGLDKAAPEQLFQQLRQHALQFNKSRYEILTHLQHQLSGQGVHFVGWKDLSPEEKNSACEYFKQQVFPVLTPLAFDSAHPFPFLSNLSFSMGLTLHRPKTKKEHFARIKIPTTLPQWFLVQRSVSVLTHHASRGVASKGVASRGVTSRGVASRGDPQRGELQISEFQGNRKSYYFLPLQELVENNLHACFPNMVVEHVVAFRVTRSADIEWARDDMDAQLDIVEEQLRQRRMANIVRLECAQGSNSHIVSLLQKELSIKDRDTYLSPGPLNYQAFKEVAEFNIPHLKYPPWVPALPKAFKHTGSSVLDVVAEQDVLVHHPFESYSDSVERFVRDAVDDERVMVIKISLYRAGTDNPIVPLLIQAAEEGKQVVCVLELKARFDEAHNIHLGEKLTKKGVHVVYGVVDKKTHAKNILVIRQEGGGFKYYTHIGTGNYNPKTAKLYCDFALFTSRAAIAAEMLELFNSLTGVSGHANYKKLLVAPVNMRSTFVNLIKGEIEQAKKGKPARIVAKMNNFEDKQISDLLYEASQQGVRVDLIVRGFCSLVPQVKGLSENIRVHSVIGRFLEHSRVYYFRSGASEHKLGQFFIGSADWRYRNFDKRVEVVVPIECKKIKKQLWADLKIWLHDELAWHLNSEGHYKQPEALFDPQVLSAQQHFMRKAVKKSRKTSHIQWTLGAHNKEQNLKIKLPILQELKKKLSQKPLCIGVIDLGSNSIKMDIARLPSSQQLPTAEGLHLDLSHLHYEKHMVRMGDGVYEKGLLSSAVMARGLEAIEKLHSQLKRYKVDEVVCLGTSALRQAQNADEFIKKVLKKTGLQVQVISGKQEALLIARGVLQGDNFQKQNFVIVDIGGGSTEFIFCSGLKVLKVLSEPLGVNQIKQACPDKAMLDKFLAESLQKVQQCCEQSPFWDQAAPSFVVGTSGTMRSLWKLMGEARGGLDAVKSAEGAGESLSHSHVALFDLMQLEHLLQRLRPLSVDELKKLPGLEPERADLILGGAVLVQQVLRGLKLQQVMVHTASLREGVWHCL